VARKATWPYYVIRVTGGALYLCGMVLMAWNTWMTMRGTKSVDVPIPVGPKNPRGVVDAEHVVPA